RPLDRTRPLWLSYVIEGLAGERFAVLTVVHHATVDGASGVELMTLMLDDAPGGTEIAPPAEPWSSEPVPGDLQLIARGTLGLARKPARLVLLNTAILAEIDTLARIAGDGNGARPRAKRQAPTKAPTSA
ncbi:MAG TPA: wax ester/triacylglycerol synthase domain-containing protein, partial [Solirubrobacteraceae bacterium]